MHYRCWEWEDREFGCDSHCRSLEHDKAEVRVLGFEYIDEAVAVEEEASLGPIVDLAMVLCDVETDAEAQVREHVGDIAQKEQEIRHDNGMVVQEMELCNERAAQETVLYNETVVQEMVLDSQSMALAIQL